MSGQSGGYAGDVAPREAWKLLSTNPKAQLVDVRTQPEWTFVGLPDLSQLGRSVHTIEWQSYPTMQVDPGFVARVKAQLERAGATADTPVLMLCRSGGRSRAAAMALTAAGFTQAYNISGGFEGDADAEGHRGTTSGWKAEGLPWRQG